MTDTNVRRTATAEEGIIVVRDPIYVSGGEGVSMIEFTDGDATPSVLNGEYFKTANTSAVSITDFDNTRGDGHHIVIIFQDNYTTVVHDATKIDMPGGVNQEFNTNDVLELISLDGVWIAFETRID